MKDDKIEIIQRLLDEGHINAKEALVLMREEIRYIHTEPYRIPYDYPIITYNTQSIN